MTGTQGTQRTAEFAEIAEKLCRGTSWTESLAGRQLLASLLASHV